MRLRLILSFTAFLFVTPLTASALDSCVIPDNATYTIDEHGVCRRITNNHASNLSVMVPTKTAAEWSTGANAFLNALPAGVTSAACDTTCGAPASCAAPAGATVSNLYCFGGPTGVPVPRPCEGNYIKVSARAGGPCAISASDNSLWCWPSTGYTPTQIPGTWTDVSRGAVICGIKTDGTAWCWGSNSDGQLGDGTTTDSATPVQVSGGGTWTSITAAAGSDGSYTGSRHVCGIKSDGTAWCWGDGSKGQLGRGSTADSSVPVPVSGGGTWIKISAGRLHTCGIKTNGTGYCWGDGADGALGDGSSGANHTRSTPYAISGGGTWIDLETGRATCGVKTGGAGYCWGDGSSYRKGNGATTDSNTPGAISGGITWSKISVAGNTPVCGIASSGDVYCWGGSSAAGTPVLQPSGLQATSISAPGVCAIGTVPGNQACSLPWGTWKSGVVADGQSATAYLNRGTCAAGCPSESRTCNNGTLSGTYTENACTPGVTVGGYCWYYDDDTASCDATCTDHGGCDLLGTRNYAGSGGTDAQCKSVLQALGESASSKGSGAGTTGGGCHGGNFYWRNTSTTLCEVAANARACACNQ